MRSGALPFLLLALAAAQHPALGEVRVGGSLEPQDVEVGESAVLSITVEGGGSIEGQPKVALPDGLKMRDAGESRNFSLVNGRFTQSVQSSYVIIPLHAGSWDLGPIEVRVGGRAYSIGPYHLNAAGGGGTPAPQQPPRGSTQAPAPAPSGPTPPILVDMRAEPAEVFVGQQVILTVRFWQRQDVSVLDARFEPAGTEGFWKQDLPPERHGQDVRAGVPYRVTEIKAALFPTRAGDLTVSPAHFSVQYREPGRDRRDPFSFFGLTGRDREVEPYSNPCIVHVRALPKPVPSGFAGAVGKFRISARLDRDSAQQGEPLTWIVTIEGEGNVSAVNGPRFPEIPGCRGLDGGSDVETRRDNDRIGGKKTFSQILIPEAAGNLDLPPLAWTAFDPEAGTYATLTIPAKRIAVTPASEQTDQTPGRVGSAIRGIRTQSRLVSLSAERPWQQPIFWVLQLIPIGALATGVVFRRRRELYEKDPVGARMRRAPRRLQAALREVDADPVDPWGRLIHAMEEFLADRYGPEVRGLTRSGLRDHLQAEGVDPDVAARLTSILERADALRYTPAGQTTAAEIGEAIGIASDCAGRLPGRRRA